MSEACRMVWRLGTGRSIIHTTRVTAALRSVCTRRRARERERESSSVSVLFFSREACLHFLRSATQCTGACEDGWTSALPAYMWRPTSIVIAHLLLLGTAHAVRVVAVGDLHGDLSATLRVLRLAGLVDARSQRWTGGSATLVQLGDVLDRGTDEPEIWSLLRSLRAEAAAAGGSVVSLLGNHEILNVCGEANAFVHASAQTSFGPDRAAAFAPGGDLARQLAECPVVAIVDDSAFVHAALPAGSTRESVARLNAQARKWLLGEWPFPPPELLPYEGSPVWERTYSSPSDREVPLNRCNELRGTLKQLGVSRMVVGHTPQNRVNAACGGAVWRCDTGVSAYVMGGTPEALEIEGGRVRVLRGDDAETRRAAEGRVMFRDFF